MSKTSLSIALVSGLLSSSLSYGADNSNCIPAAVNPAALVAPEVVIIATASITVNFTVKLSASIPLAQTVQCNVSINSSDGSFYNSASGQNNVIKTSATVGTCRVAIPYVWQIASKTTNMGVRVGLSTSNGYSVGSLTRETAVTITSFPVPTAGAKTIAVTVAL